MEGVPNHEEEKNEGEQDRPLAPQIWVASLADYNAGRLYGRWLDAAQDVAELEEAITVMLAASPTPGAEEWSIFDSEDFGGLRIAEQESLETVSLMGRGLIEHGAAFAAWADIAGRDAETLARFEEGYLGRWDSLTAYAEQLFDDMGYEQELAKVIPDGLRAYVRFDAEGFGRDLHLSGDISYADTLDGGVWIFDDRY